VELKSGYFISLEKLVSSETTLGTSSRLKALKTAYAIPAMARPPPKEDSNGKAFARL